MPERTLIVLRHAKSDWSGGESDLNRPLNDRGRRQAADVGRWLTRNVAEIDLAVVSPANRARSTWALAVGERSAAPPLRIDEDAYGASAPHLLRIVRSLPDSARTVVLVGHNPGVEDLVSLLTAESVLMPTSTLAVLALEGSWTDAEPALATLQAVGRPPEDVSHPA